jgi:hypothetical protein
MGSLVGDTHYSSDIAYSQPSIRERMSSSTRVLSGLSIGEACRFASSLRSGFFKRVSLWKYWAYFNGEGVFGDSCDEGDCFPHCVFNLV